MNTSICRFCAKPNVIAGPFVEMTLCDENGDETDQEVCICLTCATNVSELIRSKNANHSQAAPPVTSIQPQSPQELYDHMSKYVIGQEDAKRTLAVEVSNHYYRIFDKEESLSSFQEDDHFKNVEIEKSNVLMIGPSGSGKTLLIKSIADKLGVPFAVGDATTLTEAGYVGEDVENLLLKLIKAADDNIVAAQRGIIYIDEIDKIRSTSGNVSISRDVGGQGVQQSLLKLIEGSVCNVPLTGGRKHPGQEMLQIDTTQILFIVGGAFVGLDKIVAKRKSTAKTLGFGNPRVIEENEVKEIDMLLSDVKHEDLIEFGMIPEFIGRVPVLTTLKSLKKEDLIRILTEPKNAIISQERKKALYRGVDLDFTDSALNKIADLAIEMGTGARSLRMIVSSFMNEIYFKINSSHRGEVLVIDEDVVTGKKDPIQEVELNRRKSA